MSGNPLSEEERKEIASLLRAGLPVYRVAKATRRAQNTVRSVRDANSIWPRPTGKPPKVQPEEPAEEEGVGLGSPWIPESGWDMHADRPHQRRWLAMLAAARPMRQTEMRMAVCRVLGETAAATDKELTETLKRDRRSADELAGLYLAEIGAL